MNDETIRLILDLSQSSKDANDFKQKIDDLGVSFKRADEGGAKLTASQKEAAKASAEMQRGFLSLTNAAQDFQAAGLNGILNNIPQIVTQFGGTAGLAAAIGGVAVACYAGSKAFNALWAAVVDGSNDVPKSTDALKNLNDELKTNKDRLKELSDQGTLTNAQLAEYNRLTEKTVELERASNAEKERRNTIEAQRRKEGEGNAESASIASAATEQAGGVDKVIEASAQSLYDRSRKTGKIKQLTEASDDIERQRNAAKNAGQDRLVVPGPGDQVYNVDREEYFDTLQKNAQKSLKAERSNITTQASDLAAKALQGDGDASRQLARLIPGSAFGQATPEGMRAQNDEVDAVAEDGDRLHRAGQGRREAAAADGRRKNNLMEQAQIEDEEGRRLQGEDEKQAEKAGGAVDKVVEGAQRARSKFDQWADKREGKLAGVRERATLGNEFDRFAQDQGVDPTREQGDAAAKQIQGLMEQGLSKDDAATIALQNLVQNQQQLAMRLNQIKAQYDQISQQAETVPTLMDAW